MKDSTRSVLAILAVFGILVGLIFLLIAIPTIAQSRQITYKQVEKSYVSKSIQEYSLTQSSSDDPPIDYLELADGSIFYLLYRDFPDSSRLPDIRENDMISLIYDVNSKRMIDESARPLLEANGTDVQIKGEGYRIVQLTVGYSDTATGQPNDQALTSYASNDYAQHPHSYYKNTWISLTGGGFLAAGIILLVLSPFVYWRYWYKPQKMQAKIIRLR